ncbi:MAG TPA: hypothetical protein VIG33_09110 [Pseudobdellovibrionaceae bacterium]
MLRESLPQKFEAFLQGSFAKISPGEVYQWLKKTDVSKTVSQKTIVDNLIKYVGSLGASQMKPEILAALVNQIDKDFKMSETTPDLFAYFKNELAKAVLLQPHAIKTVFPSGANMTVDTKAAQGFALEVRGLSTVVALTRIQKAEDQIHMIEYIEGHRSDMPEFARKVINEGNRGLPMTEIVKNVRERLLHESTIARTLIANTFLAGPSSMIYKTEGKEKLYDHILKSVSSKNRSIANEIANALVRSLKESQSLAFAYVFGQKPEDNQDNKLSEARILKSLFEARGVAGVKLGQYLAFTGEMKEYRDVLAELQDSAMPLTYFEATQLLDKHYNGQWPLYYKVKNVLGTGSVNIAILIEDTRSGEELVVSVLRENVDVSIEEDFRSLKDFVTELTQTPEGKKKYGYLKGLLGIIKKSVSLELNKKNSFDRQTENRKLYDRTIRVHGESWQLSTPAAVGVDKSSFFMGKASGITARKLFMENPKLYNEIMTQINGIELDILLGIDETGKPKPISLMANPDFHDGQLLIDVKTKKVFILDFGQAVPLTNRDRELAIDLLRAIEMLRMHESVPLAAKLGFKKISLSILNQLSREYSNSKQDLLRVENLEILGGKTERMDIFVQVVSLLSQKQVELPISVIHWILGLNRQIVLANKIGKPIENQIRNLLLTRTFHLDLKTYNRARLLNRQLRGFIEHPEKTIMSCKEIFSST